MYQWIPSLTIPLPGDPRGFAHSSCPWGRVIGPLSCPGVCPGEVLNESKSLIILKKARFSLCLLSLVLIYRKPSAIIADEDLAIYENISFLPSPTIADRLRSSAMNQKSLFFAIIGDHRRWREVNENTNAIIFGLPENGVYNESLARKMQFPTWAKKRQCCYSITWPPMRSEMKPSPIVCEQTHVLISQAPQGPHQRWSPMVCDIWEPGFKQMGSSSLVYICQKWAVWLRPIYTVTNTQRIRICLGKLKFILVKTSPGRGHLHGKHAKENQTLFTFLTTENLSELPCSHECK